MSDKPMSKSRRDAVKLMLGGVAAVPLINLVGVCGAHAADLPHVDAKTDPTAIALKYTDDATTATRPGQGRHPWRRATLRQLPVRAKGDGRLPSLLALPRQGRLFQRAGACPGPRRPKPPRSSGTGRSCGASAPHLLSGPTNLCLSTHWVRVVPHAPTPCPVAHPIDVLLRGLVWGLIGLIYAPLFLGLLAIFRDLGLGHAAFIPAAALASAAGATLYGARQVALAGTAIGLTVASLVLLTSPQTLGLWGAVGLAVLVGAALGWWVDFPERCSLQVPAKAVAGLTAGALCGGLLALAESLHPFDFRAASTLAFLVSVTGVLYVATVTWWMRHAMAGGNRYCDLIEVGVVALLAGLASGGLWLGAAP